jgi:hypothetical protein
MHALFCRVDTETLVFMSWLLFPLQIITYNLLPKPLPLISQDVEVLVTQATTVIWLDTWTELLHFSRETVDHFGREYLHTQKAMQRLVVTICSFALHNNKVLS